MCTSRSWADRLVIVGRKLIGGIGDAVDTAPTVITTAVRTAAAAAGAALIYRWLVCLCRYGSKFPRNLLSASAADTNKAMKQGGSHTMR